MDRVERIEENEKLFREVNERVAQMQGGLGSDPDPEWICECGDETCFEKLSIPVAEYHEVRGHDDWFMIKPGHEKPEAERIVEQRRGFVIVEKDGV
jgi:hypothetical protein